VRGFYHKYRGVLWLSVFCEYSVYSGSGLYVVLITYTEESYGCLSVVSVVFCQVEFCATG